MNAVVAHIVDLHGHAVGTIATDPEAIVVVTLAEPWLSIATKINQSLRAGNKLPSPKHTLVLITEASTEAVNSVAHTIRILSERQLRVIPATTDA